MWGRAIAVWLLVMCMGHCGGFSCGRMWVIFGPGKSGLLPAAYFFWRSCTFVRRGAKRRGWLCVGLLGVELTLAFEFSFEHYVMQRSWESIGAEYNLLHGGLMPIGLAIFGMSPWIALRLRRAREGGAGDAKG
jgi:hypothetical protein